ncbi:MAG TPA: ATP-binding protein [Spirochaetota bacterium]|nr:ATP-binding protein [Spirochaetota bacterium]HQH98183.1 ATP-binding protein [Spirochaetota bacterium]
MNFLAVTGLLNFISSAFIGIFVLIKNPRASLNRHFFNINASIAVYSVGYLLWQVSGHPDTALAWFKVLFCGIILINVTFLHYVFAILGKLPRKKFELIGYYLANAVFLALNLMSLLYTGLEPRHGHGYWPVPTIIFSVYLAFWIWQLLYGFILLLLSLKTVTGRLREQVKYTIVSGLIGFIGGASNWPMWYGIDFAPYANILITGYIGLMGFAIIRFRLMDIKVVLTRTGIFVGIYTLVLGGPFLIGVRTDFGFLSFLALFVLATIGPILYRYLMGKAEGVLLAKQREYQRILNESVVFMLREHSLDRLLKLIIYGMKTIIKVDYAAIFLDDKENECFTLKVANSFSVLPEGFCIPYDNPTIDLLKEHKRPLVLEEMSHLFHSDTDRKIKMIVPSFFDNRLLGFLLLGEKESKTFYTMDDLQTFELLSHQTAMAIENCLYLDERKKTQERLFQAEKLAFIGGMAEGVAHQIRNRLNHFSLGSRQIQHEIADFLKAHADLVNQNTAIREAFDSLNDISESIVENVIRTNAVIQGILNYTLADDRRNTFSELPFKDVAEGAIDLAKIKHGIDELPIKTEIDPDAMIYGIMTQLMESLYNLIDNSYEAIEEKRNTFKNAEERKSYEPFILIRFTQQPDGSLIEITDNGIGIASEDARKIFAPYYTTKSSFKSHSELGIGLYVVHRIIEENHKGSIWFESRHMQGTSFFIKLPLQNNAG